MHLYEAGESSNTVMGKDISEDMAYPPSMNSYLPASLPLSCHSSPILFQYGGGSTYTASYVHFVNLLALIISQEPDTLQRKGYGCLLIQLNSMDSPYIKESSQML